MAIAWWNSSRRSRGVFDLPSLPSFRGRDWSEMPERSIMTVRTVARWLMALGHSTPDDRGEVRDFAQDLCKETPMRALRTTLAAAWFLALAFSTAPAADETLKKLLSYRPSFKGVEYEVPADPAALAACKAE